MSRRKEDQEIKINRIDNSDNSKRNAFLFILLMGIVSLFSDMTHEGAASIMGAYLSLAGASATAIGFVSGLGEFVGYSLRIITGKFTDKTQKYWPITIFGYVVDCVAIPLLAFVPRGGWILACGLIVIQRLGKAIKKPAKDTILSFAASQTGTGKSFAIQEFLDQLGAFMGPVMLFLVLYFKKNTDIFSAYTICFALLAIPAIATVSLLFFAKRKYPHPEEFEKSNVSEAPFKSSKPFIIYIVAISLFAMGFIDFPMITMHVLNTKMMAAETLPLLYAGAMAVDAFAALLFGWLYDKFGMPILALSTMLSAPFGLLVFVPNVRWALFVGVALWGIGMGAQESILKAVVTDIVPKQNRSSGFGVFQTSFGIFWFLGSWLMGALYDMSITSMVAFSLVVQITSIPFFLITGKYRQINN